MNDKRRVQIWQKATNTEIEMERSVIGAAFGQDYNIQGEKEMSDLYSELLVKKEPTAKDKLIKYGLKALVIVLAVGGLFLNAIFLIAAIILGIVAYFVIPGTDLEYEYLFVNGEMDIDKVMAKSKRKRVKSINMAEVDLIAPVNSHRMDYYNSNQKMKVFDYSSGNDSHKRFAVITRDNSGACKIIIEPDEAMANSIKNSAPSKVFLD